MNRLWVVGASGLLGSALTRSAQARGVAVETASIPWSDSEAAVVALSAAADRLISGGDGDWAIAWCAGVGVVRSGSNGLAGELAVFERFLRGLAERLEGGGDVQLGRGAFFMASSAGGVYAGSSSPPFTEHTQARPTSAYGETKLAMEAAVGAFSASTGTPSLIGRITNLYGPGQDLAKPQGLISHLCRSQVQGRPLSIYVPLDTRRDYLFVDDCAVMILRGLDGLTGRVGTGTVPCITKILATHRSTTVAELLGEFRRLAKRRPLLALAADSGGQPLDLRVRSVVWNELDSSAVTPLPVGLRATREDIAAQVRRGQRLRV